MHPLKVFLASSLSWILIHVKRLCLKKQGDNEVSTNESLMPLEYAWVFMHVIKDLDSWICSWSWNRKRTSLHVLKNAMKTRTSKTYLKIALTNESKKVLTRKSWSAAEPPPAPLPRVDCKTNSWVVITSIPSSTQREVCPIQCNVTMWIHVPWYV